ncbi:Major Facilitator Superfamily protein [Parabacteroides distasonis]|jgi:MFS transporter|nr:Major Facilitator Superfamily protein [Parabacteroides distasonis]
MTTKKQEKIKFSKAFWVANTVELFERAAYYGVFIVITLYLSRILGFNDIQAASIAGIFSACLYLLPTFAGALADKIGFRNSMLLAFTLLTCGYLGLAVYPTWLQSAGLVEYSTMTTFTGLLESNLQYGIIPIMALIVCGGAFIKSVISGTVAKETTPETRAKGFSIFYAMVNIGAFSGKTIVKPPRGVGQRRFDYLELFLGEHDLPCLASHLVLLQKRSAFGRGQDVRADLERLDQGL